MGPPPNTTSCSASEPDKTALFSVVAQDGGKQATLSWSSSSNATSYALSYGTKSGNYTFGVPNTGNVTSFTVGSLDPAQNYCFVVQPINDCRIGQASNEICMRTPGRTTGVLGLSATHAGTGLLGVEFLPSFVLCFMGIGLLRRRIHNG